MLKSCLPLVLAVLLWPWPEPVWAAGMRVDVPELNWILMVPPGGAEVQVLDLARQAITPLATLRNKARGGVVAVQVQRETRQVWVLGERGLDVYEPYGGRLLAHWKVPEGVRLARLDVTGCGRARVSGGVRSFEAVPGAAFLTPAAQSLSVARGSQE
ncbi:MAG: hypothetical protein J0L85_12470 [Zoogloea sp.]|nr:hypothetical protein [Zoogloea sp.]MCA0186513.1 hypothetical protein [Pseudomonadota bacterium]